jgi:hypothetical protein
MQGKLSSNNMSNSNNPENELYSEGISLVTPEKLGSGGLYPPDVGRLVFRGTEILPARLPGPLCAVLQSRSDVARHSQALSEGCTEGA